MGMHGGSAGNVVLGLFTIYTRTAMSNVEFVSRNETKVRSARRAVIGRGEIILRGRGPIEIS